MCGWFCEPHLHVTAAFGAADSMIRRAMITLLTLLSLTGSARARPGSLPWVAAYEAGTGHLAAGELDAAERDLRLAVLLHPGQTLARASVAGRHQWASSPVALR